MNDKALRVENEGSVSVTLVAESYKPINHISKITLFKNSERIAIENYITQNIGGVPANYAFSFNLTNPDIWHSMDRIRIFIIKDKESLALMIVK